MAAATPTTTSPTTRPGSPGARTGTLARAEAPRVPTSSVTTSRPARASVGSVLTRQLDAVQAVGEVLRAQRHEFANRLHLVSGLLESGRVVGEVVVGVAAATVADRAREAVLPALA
ncbi:hypothetical protein GTR00_04970, partial [Kineococcus sp. T90]|nr:hypothetical protein [Kineococcus indalonis]